MIRGTLVQVNISGGGMPKLPVAEAKVTYDGVAGDWQLDRRRHGGANRAVCLYSEELYASLREQGVDLANGQLGENFTTRGVNLLELNVGDRLRVGGGTIEITEPREPCANLRRWHPKLEELLVGRSGWLAKVVREGIVQAGDAIELLEEE